MNPSLEGLAKHELLTATHALIRRGREAEADLLRHLGEIDRRRLYLEEACSSMFVYCVRVLHFSEAAAYKRIRAARAARKCPDLLAALRRGELHLTAVSLLAAQLSPENCGEWIRSARHKTAEEIKRLLADRQPQPDRADCVRRIPVPDKAGTAPATGPTDHAKIPTVKSEPLPGRSVPREAAPATTAPLGGERYRVSFTASGELQAQLQELRALMRHQIPDGDLASILGRAVALLLDQVRRRKFATVSAPKRAAAAEGTGSRHLPAAIRRAVARRDGERCSYVSAGGQRCGAQEFLEFHHMEAWARSPAHSVDGVTLRCRAHNQHAACQDFGEEKMARFRTPGSLLT